MNIDPGELNQRVSVYRHQKTSDGMGGFTTSAVKVRDIWAKVMPIRGTETGQAGRVQAVMGYTFVIRENPALALAPDMFFRWHGRDFNIRFLPDVVNQAQFLFVETETGVAQ